MSDIVERLRAWSPLISSALKVSAAALVIDGAAAEIERLRDRVELLEKVRAAAQALIDVDGCDDPAEDDWWDWEKNCDVLRAALKEVKP
jgi:hypothetical protein